MAAAWGGAAGVNALRLTKNFFLIAVCLQINIYRLAAVKFNV